MKISNLAKWLVGVPYYLWATYSSIYIVSGFIVFMIVNVINCWKAVVAQPILILPVLVVIPAAFFVGWIVFGYPLMILWKGFLYAIKWAEKHEMLWERYAVFIGISIAAMTLPIIWFGLLEKIPW